MQRATLLRSFVAAALFLTLPMITLISAPSLAQTGNWAPAASLSTARFYHRDTLLEDGRVLVTGGYTGSVAIASAEIYSISTDSWSAAPFMSTARYFHTATLLADGRVLVTGSYTGSGTAEIYNPSSNNWLAVPSMSINRGAHTATRLRDGRVLVTGGFTGSGATASAEFYNPSTNSWSPVPSMNIARYFHTATLLADDRVLLAGGVTTSGVTASAEIYNPSDDSWSAVPSMSGSRDAHTATLLADGNVLVAGGYTGSAPTAGAEIYNPSDDSWSALPSMSTTRLAHTATLLDDGRVLVAGGENGPPLAGAELYNPLTNSWTAAASLSTPRAWLTATLLADARVLATGGHTGSTTATVEIYTPAGTTAPNTTIDSAPPLLTNSTNATFTFSSTENGTFECKLDGGSFTLCVSPQTYTNLAEGSHTFLVRAKDAAGNVDGSPASYTWTIDIVPPDTTITVEPPLTTTSTSATFEFTSNEFGTFACNLDDAGFTTCTTPVTYTGLALGSHNFKAKALDAAGNFDITPDEHSWTIAAADTTPPETAITSAPPALTSSTSATFQFISNKAGSAFSCSLDGATFTACTSPATYNVLVSGNHTFQVTATDAAGNTDPTPASYAWTIDNTAPTVALIVRRDPDPTNAATVRWDVRFSEVIFGIDVGDFTVLQGGGVTGSSILSLTPLGPDTVTVTVDSGSGSGTLGLNLVDDDSIFDQSGNPLGGPGASNGNFTGEVYTIDRSAPDTTITENPPAATNSTTASFSFTSTETGNTFACSLDGSSFTACTNPQTYEALTDGSHTFQVQATDRLGNTDPTPATYTWTINTPTSATLTLSGLIHTYDGTPKSVTVTTSPPGVSVVVTYNGSTAAPTAVGSYPVLARSTDPTYTAQTTTVLIISAGPVATDNRVYWSDRQDGKLRRSKLDGSEAEDIVAGLSSPQGIAIDVASRKIYWTNSGAIKRANLDGTNVETIVTEPGNIDWFGVALDPAGGKMYWTAGVIKRANLDGSGIETLVTGLAHPAGIALDVVGGKTYWADASTGSIRRANLDGTGVEVVVSTPVRTIPIALDLASEKLYFGEFQKIRRANLDGSNVEDVIVGEACAGNVSPCDPFGLAFDKAAGQIYWTDPAANVRRIKRANLDGTGVEDVVTVGLTSPIGIAVVPDTQAPDTTITNNQPLVTNSTTATFTFTSSDVGSFECKLDGGSFTLCVSPQTYTNLAEGSHTFLVRAKDAAGNVDGSPASYTWTIDIVPPETTITSSPSATTNSTSASFSFTSTEPGSAFACSLDSSGFTACTTPQSYSNLADGNHTFRVRAIDPAGNFDTSPASYSWTVETVDTTPPNTTITSNPTALTNSTSASFSFTSNEAASTFACSLDGAVFASCTSPTSYAGLAAGSHTFQVGATDLANNTDATPASYTWTIDIIRPNTTITAGPPSATNSTSASFSFTSPEAGSTFECSLDSSAFAPCTSPITYSGLAPGSHTFRVRATDLAGNTDPTPATTTWTIDLTAPDTTVTSSPPAVSDRNNASFRFTSTEGDRTFQCSLDGSAFAACGSPQNYSGLANGNHIFQVRAVDLAGNTDPTPASFTWTIR